MKYTWRIPPLSFARHNKNIKAVQLKWSSTKSTRNTGKKVDLPGLASLWEREAVGRIVQWYICCKLRHILLQRYGKTKMTLKARRFQTKGKQNLRDGDWWKWRRNRAGTIGAHGLLLLRRQRPSCRSFFVCGGCCQVIHAAWRTQQWGAGRNCEIHLTATVDWTNLLVAVKAVVQSFAH